MKLVSTVCALVAMLLTACPVLSEGEHDSRTATVSQWGPTVEGLALGLKIETAPIRIGQDVEATAEIVNRTSATIHVLRLALAGDYVFKATDENGKVAPPGIPLDLSVNGVSGQGSGIYPGEAYGVDFPDLIGRGYLTFPHPGRYTVIVTSKVYDARSQHLLTTLVSNPVQVMVVK
jgi:hypothetical protein